MRYVCSSLLAIILLSACRSDSPTYSTSPQLSCTVKQLSSGVSITCPDGSTANLFNGSQITAVQFCAGQVEQYPTSFPEYGLCLNNTLYAVYWDGHNSWLAQVAPGNYLSTATGLQCNFTITTGCTVQ